MTDDGKRETSRRGFLGGAVSSALGVFVGKARGAVSSGLPKIEMGDAGSDPSSNGVIARNGNRLKAYSAGQLIDFADAIYPGEDFDGQGTSQFTNLQELDTEDRFIGNYSTFAYQTSSQSISNQTVTQVNLSSTKYDDRGDFNATKNAVVASTAGRYKIEGSVYFGSMADSTRIEALIKINGTGFAFDDEHAAKNAAISAGTSIEANLSQGDEVTMDIYQDSGSSQSTQSGDAFTYLMVSQVA
jgi:hypothetical protein